MRLLRHVARRLALPLVLLLPGLGGTWLQEAHPCPTRHAAHAAGPSDAADHGHHAPAGAPEPGQDEHAQCTCVGACGQGAAPAAPGAVALLQAAYAAYAPVRPTVPAWLPVFSPTDFLPLSTAPPLA